MKERRLLVLIAVGAIVVAGAFLYTRSQSVQEPVVPPPPAPTSTAKTTTGAKTTTPTNTATAKNATTTPTSSSQPTTTAAKTTTTAVSTATSTTATIADTKTLPPSTQAALSAGRVALIVVASNDPPEDRELTKVVRRFADSSEANGVSITFLTPQKVAKYRSLAETISRTPALIVLDSSTSASVNEGYIEYAALVAMVNRKKR